MSLCMSFRTFWIDWFNSSYWREGGEGGREGGEGGREGGEGGEGKRERRGRERVGKVALSPSHAHDIVLTCKGERWRYLK